MNGATEELYNYAKERHGRVDMLWSNYYEVCLRAQTQTLSQRKLQ